jgi:hypothetical protein
LGGRGVWGPGASPGEAGVGPAGFTLHAFRLRDAAAGKPGQHGVRDWGLRVVSARLIGGRDWTCGARVPVSWRLPRTSAGRLDPASGFLTGCSSWEPAELAVVFVFPTRFPPGRVTARPSFFFVSFRPRRTSGLHARLTLIRSARCIAPSLLLQSYRRLRSCFTVKCLVTSNQFQHFDSQPILSCDADVAESTTGVLQLAGSNYYSSAPAVWRDIAQQTISSTWHKYFLRMKCTQIFDHHIPFSKSTKPVRLKSLHAFH